VAALATAGTARVVFQNAEPDASRQTRHAPVNTATAQPLTATSPSVEQPAATNEAVAARAVEPAASAPVTSRSAVARSGADPSTHAVVPPSSAPRQSPEPQDVAPALAGEVAAIDAARAALRRGDPASVTAILNAYASRFANRHFEPEALYLRMEALGREGDTDGQRSAAARLLAEFPSAPQAARARAVLDGR